MNGNACGTPTCETSWKNWFGESKNALFACTYWALKQADQKDLEEISSFLSVDGLSLLEADAQLQVKYEASRVCNRYIAEKTHGWEKVNWEIPPDDILYGLLPGWDFSMLIKQVILSKQSLWTSKQENKYMAERCKHLEQKLEEAGKVNQNMTALIAELEANTEKLNTHCKKISQDLDDSKKVCEGNIQRLEQMNAELKEALKVLQQTTQEQNQEIKDVKAKCEQGNNRKR